MTMNFEEEPKFQKELEKFKVKYPSLKKDFAELKKKLQDCPKGDNLNLFSILTQTLEHVFIIKVRVSCANLKGKPRLRLIYAYFEAEKETGQRIVFLEMYYKGKKGNEDRSRWEAFLKGQGLQSP